MNLDLYARYIRLHYPDYVVVAIDASVGSLDHVGYATWAGERFSRDWEYPRSCRPWGT